MSGRHAQRRPRRIRIARITIPMIVFAVFALFFGCTAAESDGVPAGPTQTAAKSIGLLPRALVESARAPYGSGQIGDWQSNTPTSSNTAQFANVVDNNGILIVGDSIANITDYEFATRMNQQHGLPTAVHNWPGRPTEPAADWIVANAYRIPDRGIVVASGSNDVFNPAAWWQQVNRVMAAADGKPVYWVSVFVDRWSGSEDRRIADMRNSAWLNDQLYSLKPSYPNLHIIDWHAYLSQGWNETKIASWLTDGVHPTAAGVDAWCDLLELRMGL